MHAVTVDRPDPSRRALRALALALVAALLLPCAADAAEGGPALNIPVPAGSGTATAPTAIARSPSAAATGSRALTTTAPATGTPAQTPAPASVGAPGQTPAVATLTPAPTTARTPLRHSGGTSKGAIALAAAAGLLALLCIIWAISRTLALQPRWTLSMRHSMEEAGYRASATWAELADWVRLGR